MQKYSKQNDAYVMSEGLALIKDVLKNESLLVISATLAIISSVFAYDKVTYSQSIDFRSIFLLFCLMVCVAGLSKSQIFQLLFSRLSVESDSRKLSVLLVLMCFFSSMFITNDVALITFVPFTILILKNSSSKTMIFVIVMETIAANLGSMATPFGNPQNIFLYSYYNMSPSEFFLAVLPFTIIGFVSIMTIMYIFKGYQPASKRPADKVYLDKFSVLKYTVLFIISVLAVMGMINTLVCLIIVVIITLLTDRSVLKNVDYSLLLTFLCFFVFSANISSVNEIADYIIEAMEKNDTAVSILISQIVSNVPAAVILAPYTADGISLIIGTNIGGLGTPIASLASLISYRFYTTVNKNETLTYLKVFLAMNIVFLVIMVATYCSIDVGLKYLY